MVTQGFVDKVWAELMGEQQGDKGKRSLQAKTEGWVPHFEVLDRGAQPREKTFCQQRSHGKKMSRSDRQEMGPRVP